jgi:hypothetical protein
MKLFLKRLVGEEKYDSKLVKESGYEIFVDMISEKIGDFPGIIVAFIGLWTNKGMKINDLFQVLDTNMGGNEKSVERLIVKIFLEIFNRLDSHARKVFFSCLYWDPITYRKKPR